MYEKQNFYAGQKLMASHLDAMEDAIIEALNREAVSSWNDLTDKPFGEEVVDGETVIKQIDPKYIPEDAMGVGSWDDLTNKPFGEEPIEFVEWDGNVGTNIVVDSGGLQLVNISEVTITGISDLIGAVVTCSVSGGEPREITFTESDTKEFAPGLIVNQSCYMFITAVDGFELEGLVFPKRGIYVPVYIDALPILISKIVFPKPVMGIKPLDAKYIPSSIFPEQVPPTWEEVLDKPFYETGFEYTWDGEIGDRETVDYVFNSGSVTFVYMGDARVTRDNLKTNLVAEVMRDGVSGVIDASGPVYKFVGEWDDKYYPNVTLLKDCERGEVGNNSAYFLGAIVSEDNSKCNGFTFPYRGVYFARGTEKPECYCTKLTLPHYTQKWESEYLPVPSLGQLKTFNNISWSSLSQIVLRNLTSGSSNFQALYKVSDDVIENVSQIVSAMWNHYHSSSRTDHSLWSEQTSYVYNGDGWFALMVRGSGYYIPAVLCATRDNVTIDGSTLPKLGETPTGFGFTKTITIPTKGLYVGREKEYSYQDTYSYLSELTVRLNPDKIDPKYLPEVEIDIALPEITEADNGKVLAAENGIWVAKESNVQADWNQADDTKYDYIKNKPIIRSLPEVTSEDDGKTLVVEDGVWVAKEPSDIFSAGLTRERIKALDNLFQLVVYKDDASEAYDAFKEVFHIENIVLNVQTLDFTQTIVPQTIVATTDNGTDNMEVVWSTTNDAVATVEDGVVTPIATGSCQIIAQFGAATAICDVTVSIDETQRVVIKELSADDLLPYQIGAAYNSAIGLYGQTPSSGAGTRLSYLPLDIPCSGNYAYALTWEQDASAVAATGGLETVNANGMTKVKSLQKYSSSDSEDLGWVTNGVEVTPKDPYNGYAVEALRVTFKATSSGSAKIPSGSVKKATVTRRKVK